MISIDVARAGLFILAIWLTWNADVRLRRGGVMGGRTGYPFVAWAGVAFFACAYAFC